MAATAKALGFKVLPWQRLVLNTALEQVRGRPAYRDVVISVPRQSGKSSLALSLIVDTMRRAEDRRVLYTAQTRLVSRNKLLSSWWPRLVRSPFAGEFRMYRGYGAELLEHRNGSTLQLLSASESAGHGETSHLVVIDECWVQQDGTLEQGVRPTMATVKEAQMWMLSTAGNSRSTWWLNKLEAGRLSASLGMDSGTCCFDWSAPQGSNPADEAVWWATMPALGRLIDPDTVRADLAGMDLVEFARAYLNVWPDPAGEGWKVFDQDKWRAAREKP